MVIAGAALAAACGIARADGFIDTPFLQSFLLTGVPSFDQFRDTGTPPGTTWNVQGLPVPLPGYGEQPWGGNMYCVPTSTTDVIAFLSSRGFPLLDPASGIWQSDYRDGTWGFDTYNSVTQYIASFGALMNTDPTFGTNGGSIWGATQWVLDGSYRGDFTVNLAYIVPATGTSPGSLPRLRDVIQATIEGSVCAIGVGWYNATVVHGQTYYTRNGGHQLALASGNNVLAGNTINVGLCDPVKYDSRFQQSTFSYSPYSATGQIRSIVGTYQNGAQWFVNSATVDVTNYQNSPTFDGAVEIQPLEGYTIRSKYFHPIVPIYIPNWNHPLPGWVLSSDGFPISSLSRNPVSGLLFYTTTRLGEVAYIYDTAAQRTIEMPTAVAARQILFGAGVNPYVLCSTGTLDILDVRSGALVQKLNIGASIDRMVYDPQTNHLIAIDLSHNRYLVLTGSLQSVGDGEWRALPSVPKDGGALSFAFGNDGVLYEFEAGVPFVYEMTTLGAQDYHAIPIPIAISAAAFSVDDIGRFYFSIGGNVVVTNEEGLVLTTAFSGKPAGAALQMNRSVSNYDPAIHSAMVWNND
jgi:hypothetical protein